MFSRDKILNDIRGAVVALMVGGVISIIITPITTYLTFPDMPEDSQTIFTLTVISIGYFFSYLIGSAVFIFFLRKLLDGTKYDFWSKKIAYFPSQDSKASSLSPEIILEHKYSKDLVRELRSAAQNLRDGLGVDTIHSYLGDFRTIGREFLDEGALGEAIKKIEKAAMGICMYYNDSMNSFRSFPGGFTTLPHSMGDSEADNTFHENMNICVKNLDAIIKCTKVVIYES